MYSLREFLTEYPNDQACLEEIIKRKYSDWVCKCGRTELYPVKGRTSYACACGKQVYPLAGTPLSRTKTPLTSWFYVVWVMTQTKSGVSASTMQKHLGVSYKTAWRMMMKVREMMEDNIPLKGNIEVDETYFRAKPWRTVRPLAYNGRAQTVIGFVERGGRVKTKIILGSGKLHIQAAVREHVPTTAVLYTDSLWAYSGLKEYNHHVINHSSKRYVDGHIHTNNIENVWSHIKRGIYGVYRIVHPEYLQRYLDEYAWRYSNRFSSNPFYELLECL